MLLEYPAKVSVFAFTLPDERGSLVVAVLSAPDDKSEAACWGGCVLDGATVIPCVLGCHLLHVAA